MSGELYGLAELAVYELGQVAGQSLKYSFVASDVRVGLGAASFFEAEPCGHVLFVGNRCEDQIGGVYVESTEDGRQGKVNGVAGVYGARATHECGGVSENDATAGAFGFESALVDDALTSNLEGAAVPVGGEGGGRAVVATEGHHAVGFYGYPGVGYVVCHVGLDDDARTVGFLEHESIGTADYDFHVCPEIDFLELEHGGVDVLSVEVVAAHYLALAVLASVVEPRCAAGVEHELARGVFQGLDAHVADYGDGTVACVDVAEYNFLSRVHGDASATAGRTAAGAALGLKLAGIGDVLSLDANGTAGTGTIAGGTAITTVGHDVGSRSNCYVARTVRLKAD